MTENNIEQLHEELDMYFADLNERDNQGLFLGKTNPVLQRDLILLSWLIAKLKEFELPDSDYPYKGNRNTLTTAQYITVLNCTGKIMSKVFNYDFTA